MSIRGAAVEALGVPDGGQPDQIAIPLPIPRQQHQVAVGCRRPRGLLPSLPGPEGEIGLEPENRAYLLGASLLVEGPGCVQVAMVGNGQAVHAQFPDMRHELGEPVGTVQERIFAVGVEMDEGHETWLQ